jgi:hypothetical protein
MRIESSVTAVSLLPSEAVRGIQKLPFAIGAAHYDEPPPGTLVDAPGLARSGAVRHVNELRAWVEVEVEDGQIADAGYSGGGHAGVTELDVGKGSIRGSDVVMPLLRQPPTIEAESARFIQSFGGRIGPPIPRRVMGLPLLRVAAPLAWTTLALTIRTDGRSEGMLLSATSFHRHWVYDANGLLVSKSAEIDFDRWLQQPSELETPWGEQDERALVAPAQSELELELSKEIMKGRHQVLTIQAGQRLTEQGSTETGAFLILDGVLDVSVGGQEVAEVGPGAIVGERASAEGRRTATLQARTTCKAVRFDPAELSPQSLDGLAAGHRREDD